jgi:hypothetical protein
MRSTIPGVALVIGGVLLGGAVLSAHHAFSSEFDANRPVKFKGTVSKMLWVNPHAWIFLDVQKPDGTTEEWMIEAGTPNTLLRRGLNKNSLPPGTEITVDGCQSKDGTHRANGRDLTLADGKTLFLSNDPSEADAKK